AGVLLGSWAIDSANSSPTGIAIDPANVSHIWIVDSGADRVYRYDAAATRTSGSQPAAASFALAPGNANPQGIADPPAAPLMNDILATADASLETHRPFGGGLPWTVGLPALTQGTILRRDFGIASDARAMLKGDLAGEAAPPQRSSGSHARELAFQSFERLASRRSTMQDLTPAAAYPHLSPEDERLFAVADIALESVLDAAFTEDQLRR
ncbi:MAG TPA: hypothetical protein VF175_02570, partial [Lacipirellula sp.]